MTESAFDIYQRNCDEVARAVWDRDFDLALRHIGLPLRAVTPEADVTLRDEAALIQTLEEMRENLRKLGATAFLRICREADFYPGDDGRIHGSHMSYVLRGATNLVPPYTSRMLLVRGPDGWQQTELISRVSNRHVTVLSEDIAVTHRTHTE
ncbi:hypothetical protein P6F26_14765 [Roseibacterium sp. SDUM158017]|uniref:hypothetical protein n=1 Tax=Roseicyclus salinarum TaxID=3036773 RepID=UPI002415579F|nr:hypothetical protein [Roseibacterium sp. SDUM158017]MDG4649704.1 hypothetical protein [Roseibacterium sp. SDUM158017]